MIEVCIILVSVNECEYEYSQSCYYAFSLTWIGSNVMDEWVNALCVTRSFAYACWLSRDFSYQFEDSRLPDGPIFFWSDPIFVTRFRIMRGVTRTQVSRYSRTDCTVCVCVFVFTFLRILIILNNTHIFYLRLYSIKSAQRDVHIKKCKNFEFKVVQSIAKIEGILSRM